MMTKKEKKRVPELRFPGFEGEWEEKKVKDLFLINAGGDIKKENVSEIKTDVFKYPIYANSEKNKGLYGYSDIYKVEGETLTITGRGVNIGVAHSRSEKYFPIVRLLVLKPKNNENVRFFDYQFNRQNIFIESTGVPQLTAPQVSSYMMYKPILEEQQKIATFLTSIDTRIQQLEKKRTLLEQYKKGVMQQIFKQEIRFKDEEGKEFPKWEKKRLGEYLVEFNDKSKYSDQYPVLTSSRKGIMFQTDYFSGNQVASKDNTGYNIVPRGYFTYRHMSDDLIFKFNRNTICNKGIVSTLYPVFTTKNIDDRFLELKLNEGEEIKKYALLQKQGGSRTYLYFNKLSNMKINLPCLEEQTKIAQFLSAIDSKIAATNEQIAGTKEWKKGLLQRMFV